MQLKKDPIHKSNKTIKTLCYINITKMCKNFWKNYKTLLNKRKVIHVHGGEDKHCKGVHSSPATPHANENLYRIPHITQQADSKMQMEE